MSAQHLVNNSRSGPESCAAQFEKQTGQDPENHQTARTCGSEDPSAWLLRPVTRLIQGELGAVPQPQLPSFAEVLDPAWRAHHAVHARADLVRLAENMSMKKNGIQNGGVKTTGEPPKPGAQNGLPMQQMEPEIRTHGACP